MSKGYISTINQSGYMPEIEPCEFSTMAESKDYLLNEISRHYDDIFLNGDDETQENMNKEYKKACENICKYGCGYFDGYEYETHLVNVK